MAEQFAERAVTYERPERFHTLLRGGDGTFLGIGGDGKLASSAVADDQVVWDRYDGEVRHAATGRTLPVVDGTVGVNGERFAVSHGPELLPSEYLRFFEDNGWVCLTCVLSDQIVDGLRRVACTDQYADREPDRSRVAISQHVAVAQTAAEPISLWLIREYMGTPDISMAHAPAMAVLTKDDGKRPVQGWHSDYPYHWGLPAPGQVPVQPGASRLGVQRNVCVSDFTKVRGATAFKLGSHAKNEVPRTTGAPPPATRPAATGPSTACPTTGPMRTSLRRPAAASFSTTRGLGIGPGSIAPTTSARRCCRPWCRCT